MGIDKVWWRYGIDRHSHTFESCTCAPLGLISDPLNPQKFPDQDASASWSMKFKSFFDLGLLCRKAWTYAVRYLGLISYVNRPKIHRRPVLLQMGQQKLTALCNNVYQILYDVSIQDTNDAHVIFTHLILNIHCRSSHTYMYTNDRQVQLMQVSLKRHKFQTATW